MGTAGWALGAALCELAAAMYAGGICVQRYALSMPPPAEPSSTATTELLSKAQGGRSNGVCKKSDRGWLLGCCECRGGRANLVWFAGVLIYNLSGVVMIGALASAPLSLVTSLFSTSLVFNAAIATNCLGERLYQSDKIGLVVIICGITVCAIFADKTDEDITPASLRNYASSWSAVVFYLVLLALNLGCTTLVYSFESRYPQGQVEPPANTLRKMVFVYPIVLATFESTLQVILKALSGLAKTAMASDDAMAVFGSATFLLTLALLALDFCGILFWLRKNYKRFESSEMLPIQVGTLSTLSNIGGLLFYQEYKAVSAEAVAMTCFGIVIIYSGIVGMRVAAMKRRDGVGQYQVVPVGYS